jgi:hypothetical protein
MKTETRTEFVGAHLAPQVRYALRVKAALDGVSMSEALRRLIQNYIGDKAPPHQAPPRKEDDGSFAEQEG